MLKIKKALRGRPMKCRCVRRMPRVRYFKPLDIPESRLERIVLTIDECEALCLADRQGMYQADAAAKMKVSRQTFGNIVESARRKVAEAILCGKMLKIDGGTFKLTGNTGKKGSDA
jgi:uncharacterized protein